MKIGFIANNDLGGVEEDARFAAEHGFEGLEFNYWGDFKDLTFDTVSKMRAILVEHGVKASALGLWGWNHTSRDAAEREASLKMLDRAIGFARHLEASILITGGGHIKDASPEENAAEFARVFPPYVEKARVAGLRIALYPVHGNSFFTTAADYQRVWDAGLDVGIKLDPANIRHHGDDYLPILRDYGWRITHMHIKEHLYMDGKLVSQPAAGMGDIEWGKVFAFLHEHHYDGYLSIEPHGSMWSRPPLRRKMLLLTQRYIRQFLA
ncbi:MAG TPA: sugar phosphate isomerase/epimerase family protein [Planctomycetota bacterium]|nr:sugar phosphate isomerase/epimerase family protein [Planctomycetota bacterium]